MNTQCTLRGRKSESPVHYAFAVWFFPAAHVSWVYCNSQSARIIVMLITEIEYVGKLENGKNNACEQDWRLF